MSIKWKSPEGLCQVSSSPIGYTMAYCVMSGGPAPAPGDKAAFTGCCNGKLVVTERSVERVDKAAMKNARLKVLAFLDQHAAESGQDA